jgi:hypothetical protein
MGIGVALLSVAPRILDSWSWMATFASLRVLDDDVATDQKESGSAVRCLLG